jgi:hypothetical protein
MTRGLAAAAVVLTVAVVVGCDRGGDAPPAGSDTAPVAVDPSPGRSATSTAPAATSPATTQAATESLINIDGNLVLFPAAKLRIDESDGKVVARLFSDDPKGAALDENYDGNSFYLQIELDPEDAKDLNGVVLTYRAPTSERDDSPYGIFLEGRRWVLQPDDVKVAFEGSASPLDVQVTGTFLMFDTTDETAKPKRAQIAAKLNASVQARK